MTQSQIQQQASAYFEEQPVLRAWLFGSQAEGTADEHSDVDILVELDYSEHIGLRFVKMWLELSAILGRKVDLVPTDGLSPFIASYVEQQKMLIYEKDTENPA